MMYQVVRSHNPNLELTSKVYRWHHENPRQWLQIIDKSTIEVTEAKKWSGHGNLVDKEMAGNGYHGRCENCGLPYVTDLGYCSWTDSKCFIDRSERVIKDISYRWMTSEKRATKLNAEDANGHFMDLIHKQGWGRFCFGINPPQ